MKGFLVIMTTVFAATMLSACETTTQSPTLETHPAVSQSSTAANTAAKMIAPVTNY
jgi:hypothetical protein